MASKGTRGTAIAFGGFQISVSMVKAKRSRDLKVEYVNEAGDKVTMSGSPGGSRTPAPGVEKAVRVGGQVVRLPKDELDAIERASKDQWGTMQVLECIDYRQVPTERIEGSYWLQPAAGSADGLYLLHAALADLDRVAVVKWVSTSREKLGVIRPRWVRRGSARMRALLLSELTFANDFADPDDDALAINEAQGMWEAREDDSHQRALDAARDLVTAFSREHGDEKAIDVATDSAVDARLELLERLQSEQLTRSLEEAVGDEGVAHVVDIESVRSAA